MQTSKQYNAAVVIGRMNPPHLGHLHLINHALEIAEKVIVLVGSSFRPRDPKNPFTHKEIEEMLLRATDDPERVHFLGLQDFKYSDNSWIEEVQRLITWEMGNNPANVAIVGHDKDESSYYLKIFPEYRHVDPGEFPLSQGVLSSTKIRELLFTGNLDFIRSVVPPSTFDFLEKWVKTEIYTHLRKEYEFNSAYKLMWSSAPYPPTLVTVDAVVIQSGHLLLVKRRNTPGKGLWALPGGYLNQEETLLKSCIRELYEETRIKVPEPVLSRNIVEVKNFDHPGRSLRGRVITTAFHFRLGDTEKLPRVKGGDDAAEAAWFPISQVRDNMSHVLFEDHWDIATYFINR